jgi:3-dehydroquinate dehydratase-2
MKILMINGPNLNLLGTREPEIYGSKSLSEIRDKLEKEFSDESLVFDWRQSNNSSELIMWIQCATEENIDAIVINPAGLTHTSVALMDALSLFKGKKVEVHLSNTYKREEFRKIKLTSKSCNGVIEGFGPAGYELAVRSLLIDGE